MILCASPCIVPSEFSSDFRAEPNAPCLAHQIFLCVLALRTVVAPMRVQ